MQKFPFKVLGLAHIGLAPKDPLKLKNFFDEVLGLNFEGTETVPTQRVHTAFYDSGKGGAKLEVLESIAAGIGPISAFLEKRGGGVHHIALEVDNLSAALKSLKEKNVDLIDKEPRVGAHHTKVAFIHPKVTGGILIELVENVKEH